MSYQVLARKWRPRIFREMVGQEHVLQALINALDHNRLHHAYLFTGTRGVGKTTIARILAKCLNCETGVSSEPCGKCSACTEINEGRFVDLIEVDAASRTKVEDTRELLDNVQYAPTRGRYKIYLIDEVHMLSNHSFNALLKTLEEPPEHVKFLLATTDPQKLPVTILSRCLQFNLKNMSSEKIVEHLRYVLSEELVPFDDASLWFLARAADGSMRDALSLTDQSISFGNGKLSEKDIAAMLGTIDQRLIHEIIESLINLDAKKILSAVALFSEQAPDYRAALADLLSILHRVAIAQALPEALDNSFGDQQKILSYAEQLAAEDVQLFYQTALIGRRDLPLSADMRSGFEMTLLRMLAFKPQGVADVPHQTLTVKETSSIDVETQELSKPQGEPDVLDVETGIGNSVNEKKHLAPNDSGAHSFEEDSHENISIETSDLDASSLDSSRAIESNSDGVNDQSDKQTAQQLRDQVKQIESSQFETNTPVNKKTDSDEGLPDKGVSDSLSSPEQKESFSQSENRENKKLEQKEVESASSAQQTKANEVTEKKETAVQKISLADATVQSWIHVYRQLNVKGIISSTAANSLLIDIKDNTFQFLLDDSKGSLFDASHSDRLAGLLSDYFSETIRVDIQLGKVDDQHETPARIIDREQRENYAKALTTLKEDSVVKVLESQFGAQLDEDSIIIH